MAGEAVLRCIFEVSVLRSDAEIEQRPYHRYCNCPLHRRTNLRISPSNANISYPVRRSWSENCLVMQPRPGSLSSSPSSPALVMDKAYPTRLHSQGSLQKMDWSGFSLGS